ncbi:Uncharacterized protein HSRCO_0591 [Halanaeroarchaeum sp. HSR-CO]|uniref:DUF7573 domain-containing protein n=1 Tax=Halanaeroarchaeum sp. HSR-CO TaxID=2866382 RepID=UPI00217D72C5|nr:hypothetical protein [Halanaeroarchaeum sp. HSR-CO]UWG46886.1 Uncharacterized protein HSRCO_0591 [Halanaeroarchaeum sp. HSR-CO]
MTRDARLDAFAARGAATEDTDGEGATEDAAEDGETEVSDERVAGEDPPSLVTTSEWTPDGEECPTCGEVVERRWRQNGALVCPECKNWSEL